MAVFRHPLTELSAFLLRLEQSPLALQQEVMARLGVHVGEERLHKMQQVLSLRTQAIVPLIENVYQPQNASAVLRTAEGLGLQSIYIVEKEHRYQVSPQIVMGADKWLDFYYAPHAANGGNAANGTPNGNADAASAIAHAVSDGATSIYGGSTSHHPTLALYHQLRRKGYRIAATCWTDDAIPLHELDLSSPIALVFGTELTGLTQEAIEKADLRTYIPMYGFTQSFNISVAAAIALRDLRLRMSTEHPDIMPLKTATQNRILVQWMASSLRLGEDLLKPYFDHPDLMPLPADLMPLHQDTAPPLNP